MKENYDRELVEWREQITYCYENMMYYECEIMVAIINLFYANNKMKLFFND